MRRLTKVLKDADTALWNDARCFTVYRLALVGLSDEEISFAMGVDKNTFSYWCETRVEFADALSRGRLRADSAVAEAMFKLAIGYDYEEDVAVGVRGAKVRVKRHMAPNAQAAKFWLEHRQSRTWSNVTRVDVTKKIVVEHNIDFSDFTDEEIRAVKKMGLRQHIADATRNN
jgi:hypothetical protein